MSRMLWWLDTMMAGPSTSKFSSPFTSNLRPKKYLKVLTTVLMILGKRKEESGQTAAGQGCNGVCCTVLHQKGWKEVRIVFQPASSLICPWFT